eukprot:TRINITY_DN33051_c0_g1_i1.p1 TRINITY_DN33051_c0_g1~~TRINITY_DN33051_c0_g1_i1.p1  ORF type:complete len:344 (-),score=123.31 TRINITY_DN33051_c0_g1_i1:60-1091(-)
MFQPLHTQYTNRKMVGGFLMNAPSFLFVPDAFYYDEEKETQVQLPTISPKGLSMSTSIITPTSTLKESFDAFLQSIEPLICDTRLNVGVSQIPHPAKVAKGGEDAYFLSDDRKVIGVADGVGGWADIGVDPALYAQSLMEGSKLAAENALGSRDPVDIMQDAYRYSSSVHGSSTCCILSLEGLRLNAANLGDSGFMVVRGSQIVYRSKEQQHSFNFPYQIGTGSADKPEHSMSITVDIQPGDLVIAGTDGLWDNLYDEDIMEAVAQASDPASIAQVIGRQAHLVANDKSVISPFSKSARSNGYPLACGGKLDDITVLVGRVVLNCPEIVNTPTDTFTDITMAA